MATLNKSFLRPASADTAIWKLFPQFEDSFTYLFIYLLSFSFNFIYPIQSQLLIISYFLQTFPFLHLNHCKIYNYVFLIYF